MNFTDKLHKAIERNASLVCLGLDPDPELMPPDIDILTFNVDDFRRYAAIQVLDPHKVGNP